MLKTTQLAKDGAGIQPQGRCPVPKLFFFILSIIVSPPRIFGKPTEVALAFQGYFKKS